MIESQYSLAYIGFTRDIFRDLGRPEILMIHNVNWVPQGHLEASRESQHELGALLLVNCTKRVAPGPALNVKTHRYQYRRA